jgi:hypothetical protein
MLRQIAWLRHLASAVLGAGILTGAAQASDLLYDGIGMFTASHSTNQGFSLSVDLLAVPLDPFLYVAAQELPSTAPDIVDEVWLLWSTQHIAPDSILAPNDVPSWRVSIWSDTAAFEANPWSGDISNQSFGSPDLGAPDTDIEPLNTFGETYEIGFDIADVTLPGGGPACIAVVANGVNPFSYAGPLFSTSPEGASSYAFASPSQVLLAGPGQQTLAFRIVGTDLCPEAELTPLRIGSPITIASKLQGVIGLGDLDGDGVDELGLLVKEPAWSSGNYADVAYVFSGATHEVMFSTKGKIGDRRPVGMASCGDIDGDGSPDWVTLCNTPLTGNPDVLYWFSGADGSTVRVDSIGDNASVLLERSKDVDGDGVRDVHVEWSVLEWKIFSGSTGAVIWGTPGTSVIQRVQLFDDIDGDGHSDLLGFTNSPPVAGVYSGLDQSLLWLFPAPILGILDSHDVTQIDDVNGDGIADLIVTNDLGSGPDVFDIRSGVDGSIISTLPFATEFGSGLLKAAGDVDGDGRGDFLQFDYYDGQIRSGATGTVLRHFGKSGFVHTLGGRTAFLEADGDGLTDYVRVDTNSDNPGLGWSHLEYISALNAAGCPGATSPPVAPWFEASGCSLPGETISISMHGGLGGSTAWVVMGLAIDRLPMVKGCTLNVSPILDPIIGPIPLTQGGPGDGSFTLPVAIPVGTPPGMIALQAFVPDPAGPHGFTSSAGVLLEVY